MKLKQKSISINYDMTPEIGKQYKHNSLKSLFTVCNIKNNTVELIKDKGSTIYEVGIDYFSYSFTKYAGRK